MLIQNEKKSDFETTTVRVELESASEVNYRMLDEEMENRGFSRLIKGSTGESFLLPATEYSYLGSSTPMEIVREAELAAIRTGKRYQILATKGARAFCLWE
ncbi:MAG: hypothetical protein JWN25_1069 [Verrucomicrobiales bacterium]|nr:hypothetical protein [Verrucomicrobiales bacterium]MDB6129625.1 hypothetical protein [Verrucomicrobiales bacterium]